MITSFSFRLGLGLYFYADDTNQILHNFTAKFAQLYNYTPQYKGAWGVLPVEVDKNKLYNEIDGQYCLNKSWF